MTTPSFFVWKDTFALGINDVDVQHQWFFEIINRLYAAMMCGSGQQELRVIHDELRAYARVHFSEEERFLTAIGYPELKEHRKQHAEFMRQLLNMQLDQPTAGSTLALLKDWLLEHILGTDKAYALWITANVTFEPQAHFTQKPIATAGNQPMVATRVSAPATRARAAREG